MIKHSLNPNDFITDEIISIEPIGEIETVDITVDDTHMFFANDVYSHNSSAEGEIIVGEQVAGAYAKIMIGDFVISLSRKVTDKISGTGRFYIIKNRFGPDGLTLPSKINMSCGRMEIFEASSVQGVDTKKIMDSGQEVLRKTLATKFKEINGSSLG